MIREYFELKRKKEKFENLMLSMGMAKFYLIEDKKIPNGHILKIGIPPTSSYKKFEEKKEQLQDHFKGIVEMEKIRFTSMIQMKVITKDIGNYIYEPVRPDKYYKLYIAKTFDTENFFVDLNKDAHMLIAGVTGTGKSYLLAIMLTNILYYYPKAFEVYLCQTAKKDIDYIKNCKGIKASLYTADETALVLEKAINEINKRAEMFANVGARGLDHYNKVTDSKIKRKLFIFDEISLYMADETDTEEEAAAKNKVWKQIWKIVKLGREVGIHFIGLTQRTTVANLGGNGEIKSQLCRITFRQAQKIDSNNCIDTDLATTLRDRECYVLSTEGLTLVKVPSIDKEMTILNKYLPEIKVANKANETKVEVKTKSFRVESFDSYDDIKLEDYNKITAKKENIVANDEASQEVSTEEPPKKRKGRPRKKGAVIEDVAVTK